MHVSLTPELERQVKSKVDSGLYNNASEVVRESLRLLLKQDAMHEQLRAEIKIGYDQLKRGEGIAVATEADFQSLAKSVR
ncbi:MAG: type II toxin-antitoxin system ParD family antitoxin [Akkermansiaceae bacterium]|nr:type II toxin-antitoxin system ParD family antitoxin [Akkermansiaceae bacterium]